MTLPALELTRESQLIDELTHCAAQRDTALTRAEAAAEASRYLWRELRAARAEVARLAAVLGAATPITEE